MTVAAAARSEPGAPGADLERRRRALDLTGWGRPFKFVQPRNPCFWVFLALTGWGLVQLVKQFKAVEIGTASLISALAFMALYTVVLALVFRSIDRYGMQPLKLLAVAFVWGATAAIFGMAIGANGVLSEIYGKLFGTAFVTDWSDALTAPFVEETAKAAGFLLLLGLAPGRIRSFSDALLVGAFLGLGFEILEDLLYTFNAAILAPGADQVGVAFQMMLTRSATGLFSHALFTAFFSAGIIHLIGTPALDRNVGRGLLLIAIAVIAHAVWDGSDAIADDGGATVLVTVGIVLVGLAAFVYAFRLASSQDREWLRDVLRPEVDDGVLAEDELLAVAGTRRERRTFVKAGGEGSREGRRRRRRLLGAGLGLNRAIATAENGDRSVDLVAAREKVSDLSSITADRQATPAAP